jgi:AcrR family transcriptional regulator
MTASSQRRTASAPRIRDEARALWRKAILDAAEQVFAERGFAAARVQDIAVRAGLAVGTIYNHFDQKEDILFALLEERTSAFLEVFQPLPGDPAGYEERLLARIVRLLDYVRSHRQFFQLASEHGLFGTASTTATALLGGRSLPHAGRYEEAVLRIVEEGLAERVLAPRPPLLLAIQLRNSMRSASQWMKSVADVSPEDAARAAVELFLRGAAAAPSTRSPKERKPVRRARESSVRRARNR